MISQSGLVSRLSTLNPRRREVRIRVKGLGEIAILLGGVPVEGLPVEIYQMREQIGTENTTQM